MNEQDHVLTEAGQARRRAMQEELVAAMEAIHRRRRVRRRTMLIAAPVLAAAIAAAVLMRQGSSPESRHQLVDDPAIPNQPEETAGPSSTIMRIATDPGILDRCRIATASRVERLDDERLLNILQEINRPAGLIVMDGQARLTAPVADLPPESRG